jgi:25S rRNA (uracil2634-N3)-methyltransferase
MTTPIVVAFQAITLEGKKDEKVVKWLKHYSSAQSILIVGDGDFSFSWALAAAFGSGENIVATSLDSYGSFDLSAFSCSSSCLSSVPLRSFLFTLLFPWHELIPCWPSSWTANLISMYGKAKSNVAQLKRMGATVLHGVDVKNMKRHIDLKFRRFDRVVFNFPHAGFIGKEENQVPTLVEKWASV